MPQTRTRAKTEPEIAPEDTPQNSAGMTPEAAATAAAQLDAAVAAAADEGGPVLPDDEDDGVWATPDVLYPVDANGTPHVDNEPHSFDVAPFVLDLLRELHGEFVAVRWVEYQKLANGVRGGTIGGQL